MAASDLYSSVLSDLTDARSIMLSPAWQAELDKAPPAVRVDSGTALMHLQGAILALSNASLSDIAEDMRANEAELTAAISGLTQALKNITQVQGILNNVTKVLGVVAKVVPLL